MHKKNLFTYFGILFVILLLSSLSTKATDITNCIELQNMSLNLSGQYTLKTNIDCSATSGWNGGQGFIPIGGGTAFTGSFDGKNYNISGLYVNRAGTIRQGLFSVVGTPAVIQNVGLVNEEIRGSTTTGGLVGYVTTTAIINNTFTTGLVIGDSEAGGIVGRMQGGSISNTYSTSAVWGSSYVGGVAGYLSNTPVLNVYATGNILATSSQVGGLVGYAINSPINSSYATGNVEGSLQLGGLIGQLSTASVYNSYARGNVKGTSGSLGGLIGLIQPTSNIIFNCSATGNVEGNGANIGGLIGDCRNAVSNCYATGTVKSKAGTGVGGLIGYATSDVNISYATGNVNGASSRVGGLIGDARGVVYNVYARGNVTGQGEVGGLIGYALNTFLSRAYATGNVNGGSTANAGGLVGHSYNNMSNVFSTGNVTGTLPIGGLVGLTSGAIYNAFWYNTTKPSVCVGTNSGGNYINCTAQTNLSYFYAINNSPMASWDFTNIWGNVYDTVNFPPLLMQGLKNNVSQGNITSNNTCIYPGSGIWVIQVSDNCTIGSQTINNTINVNGTGGYLYVNGTVLAKAISLTPSIFNGNFLVRLFLGKTFGVYK